MAKIEKETSDSIIKNGYLLASLSRERVWDEIKKSYSQSKDFNEYLKYLLDFNLMQYIFPGANINKNLVESKDFIVVIANLFKNEPITGLERKMVQEYKIDYETATKVVFLISLFNFRTEDVFDIYKKKQQCGIPDSTIMEWIKIMDLPDEVSKFVNYRPSVSSRELMDLGFSGKSLGDEIKKREVNKFKQSL
jgi:hypothetical protein